MVEISIDEPQLVARLRAGEESAFEQLVRSTSGKLLAAARRILRNEDDAREAVQSAFVRAFQSLKQFREQSRISTWLHRILINEALMKLRSRAREEEEPIDPLLPEFLEDGHRRNPGPDWTEAADAAMERAETAAMISRCIDQLPKGYRTVLLLRDVEGMSNSEIAEMLGVTTNVVKVRVHRARQALRTLLERQFGGRK